MKKKQLLLASVAMFASGIVSANTGLYIGADIALSNETELEDNGISITADNDPGYNFVVGYDMQTHDSVKIGFEGEYRTFGEVNYSNIITADGNGVFLNAKPKLYAQGSNVYFAGLFGVGKMDLDITSTQTGVTINESSSALQYGAEIGFEFEQNLVLNAGYRAATAEIKGTDVSVSGLYAGARFKF
ncbi:outer membrane beta-barrel protein [Vibrio nereis]|uniref:outer membrane beta-barrel protein n=1 Tax=Vibrio nereis TaxID=693 RepID=UPI0006A97F1A|nr:outer membrane beta-barrel protein [Vibrio nereis]